MSGADENLSKPQKPTAPTTGPSEPLFETTDFSVSTDRGLTEKLDQPHGSFQLPLDAYATQVTQQHSSNGSQTENVSSSAAETQEFPTDIPGFIVESELGRGAFGVVYCARDELLDRKVAIKKPLLSNPAHRKQYIDEARKAVKLDHPGIVPIYQVGMTSKDEPFVVQKLIEGSTLRQMLQNGDGRLQLGQTIAIMRQVCLAVDAAHAAGIVHRDLKPENLLIEPDGRVYVADFGLAILEDDDNNKKGREIAGTPLYMSPEQFTGRVEWLDGRSDIWALGVILYELLSGKTPFTGKTLSELRDQIKNKDPRPIHQRDPKIPGAFDAVFRKCCAKAVGDRYASTREMLAELESIHEALPHLETIAWDPRTRSSLSSRVSTSGSAMNVSQTWLETLGFSTQRKTQSSMGSSIGGATERRPNVLWPLVGIVFFLSLVGGTSIAYFMKLGPFASVVLDTPPRIPRLDNIPEPTSNNLVPSTIASMDPKSVEPKMDLPPQPPEKPYVVSMSGKGTHDSIAKAIAESDAGDKITILAGTYRESIVIDRSITIVGQDNVRIVGTEDACIRIKPECAVNIESVVIDCQAPKFNAIDMEGGRLLLRNSQVFASTQESYDCVKARANATFAAEKCKFQSTVHAAISGEKTSSIAIRESEFSFLGTSDAGKKRVGVQATGAFGAILNCTFLGPCKAGIDWKDCHDEKESLTISSCEFKNCETGIQATSCETVFIKGTAEKPCTIENASWGVSVKKSNVDISYTNVVGFDDRNKMGLQVTLDSVVTCSDCEFQGTSCGVLINHSSATFNSLLIRDTSFIGMLVDGGKVEGGTAKLLNASKYGLVILDKLADIHLNSLQVQAARSLGQKEVSAVYATAGAVGFKEGIFADCLAGIFIDPNRELMNETGPSATANFLELMGEPVEIQASLATVEVDGDLMSLTNCDYGWVFSGAGTSRIRELGGDTPAKKLVMKKPELQIDNADNTVIIVSEKQ